MVKGKDVADSGFKYIGTPYEQMDCQAFVEKCLSDNGIKKDLGGSNSWYREVMKNGWVGTPEECKKLYGKVPTGAFLFILSPVSEDTPEKFRHDGIGDVNHIGLVTDHPKGAIHSSHKNGGVRESEFHGETIKNGGWNRVGLWDFIDYGVDFIPENPDRPSEDETVETATVHSDNGKSVKMRAKPSTNCGLYWDIDNGTIVDLLQWKDDWSKIAYDGHTGYMMSQFLIRGEVVPGDKDKPIDDAYVTVRRDDLQRLYDLIGDMLATHG